MRYAQKSPARKHRSRKKWWILVFLLVLVVGGGTASAYWYHRYKDARTAKTTSTSKTAQNNYHGGDNRTPQPTGGTSQGGAKDNKGDSGAATPRDSSTSSATGVITVLGLSSNSLLKSGDTLHGTVADKAVSQVQFRIKDDSVGLVGQGQLSVVNGTFSGTLSFTPRSGTGELDVFTFDSASRETNNIKIPVRFN